MFEWAYARRMVETLRRDNIVLAYHICGDATAIVPDMVDTGATILELDYKVDRPKVKAATAGRTTVLGPIDPSGVLALGTPDLVDEKSKEAIEILGPNGGLILGPGCALPPATPPDNIHALVAAAKKYGVYA
jgi:uroporphyrinogen-III decarboxylase